VTDGPAPLGTAAVVRTFFSMKWRLMRAPGHRRAQLVLGAVFATAWSLAAFLVLLRGRWMVDALDREWQVLGLLTLMVVGWSAAPLLVGVEEAIDPRKLALVPLRPRQMTAGLLASACLGVGQVAVAVALLGLVAGHAPPSAGAVLVVAAVPVAFLQGLLASRVVASLLARAQRSRTGRDLATVLGASASFGSIIAIQLVSNAARLDRDLVARVVDVLAWFPPGWTGRAVLDARAGASGTALLWLLAASASVVLGGLVWMRLTASLLIDDGSAVRVRHRRGREGAAVLDGATTPFAAAIAKDRRYLWRAPIRRVSLLTGVAGGVLLGVAQLVVFGGDPEPWRVYFTAAGLSLLSGTCNNLLGYDAAPMWMEVAAGGPDRTTLLARSVVWLPGIVLPVAIAAVVGGALTGGWVQAGETIAMTAACAPLVAAVGIVVSSRAPLPLADDANPFVRHEVGLGRGCVVGLHQAGAMIGFGVLAVPPVVLALVLGSISRPLVVVAALLSALWSVLWLRFAARRTAQWLRGREPDLLAILAVRQVT
jgi:ABC-2 type transport system permease protein